MSYIFEPNKRYRMPTHFGPSLGPRQGLDGRLFPCTDTPYGTLIQATFKADAQQLEKHLPPKFEVREPSTINLCFLYRTRMEWLAGRGYNEFGVTVPVTYQSSDGPIEGNLLLVIWENLADAIITGREDLGVAKLFCDIPVPQYLGGDVVCRASWDGHQFASLTLKGLKEGTAENLPASVETAGTFHYKYMPRTNIPGEADAHYVVLAPDDTPNGKLDRVRLANNASAQFQPSTFEQLPTLVHIINALSAIELGECVEANIINYHGGKDLSDMRIVD